MTTVTLDLTLFTHEQLEALSLVLHKQSMTLYGDKFKMLYMCAETVDDFIEQQIEKQSQ